jgi:hypothetical protein
MECRAEQISVTRWREGEVSAERIGKWHFRGVAFLREARLAPFGPLERPRAKNWDGTVQTQAVWRIR